MNVRRVPAILAASALCVLGGSTAANAALSPVTVEVHADLNKAFDQFAAGIRAFILFVQEHNDVKARAAVPNLITDLNQLIADKTTLVHTLSVVAMEPGKPRAGDKVVVIHETETVMDELGRAHRDMLAANAHFSGSSSQPDLQELFSSKSKGMSELRQHADDVLADRHGLNRWIGMLKRWIERERADVRALRTVPSPIPMH